MRVLRNPPLAALAAAAFLAVAAAFVAAVSLAPPVDGEPPRPFTTDQCSVVSPLARLAGLTAVGEECCEAHDRAYWRGGSARERWEADRQMLLCVAERGHPFNAAVRYLAVRPGGYPLLPTSWRWNYGHPYPRGYARDDQW